MARHADIPESVREYFGHDKVALFGAGGMPAAPPAPPGSPARKQGETALADALAKAGTPGVRPGSRPAAVPPRPGLTRAMRGWSERSLMEASAKGLSGRLGLRPPHEESPIVFRTFFVPVYRALPWSVKRLMVSTASGVRGWRRP
jgi:hypothetical protein